MLFECQKRKREESTEENDTTDLTPNSKAELFLKDLSSVSTQDKKSVTGP